MPAAGYPRVNELDCRPRNITDRTAARSAVVGAESRRDDAALPHCGFGEGSREAKGPTGGLRLSGGCSSAFVQGGGALWTIMILLGPGQVPWTQAFHSRTLSIVLRLRRLDPGALYPGATEHLRLTCVS